MRPALILAVVLGCDPTDPPPPDPPIDAPPFVDGDVDEDAPLGLDTPGQVPTSQPNEHVLQLAASRVLAAALTTFGATPPSQRVAYDHFVVDSP